MHIIEQKYRIDQTVVWQSMLFTRSLKRFILCDPAAHFFIKEIHLTLVASVINVNTVTNSTPIVGNFVWLIIFFFTKNENIIEMFNSAHGKA